LDNHVCGGAQFIGRIR